MKSAVLTALRKIEIKDMPLPEPGTGEVRLKVAAVGVCGSDVHYHEEGRIGSQVVKFPQVLGHEPSGVVDAVGAGVKLKPGDRVAVEPANHCGKCVYCQRGRQNLCLEMKFLGTPPIDGIFSQYRVMPEHCCFPISDSMSLTEASLLEPLGVGFHAVNLAKVGLGDTVAVFGSGPIGLVTLLAAKAAGAAKVFMTDLIPERLTFALKTGADYVMNPSDGDVVEWILDNTGGLGVDVTVDAAGKQETLDHCCLCSRRGGKAVIVGIPSVDRLLLPLHEVRRRELEMHNARRSNGEMKACIELVASGRINVKPLATHFFPLEKISDAFSLVHNYADGVIRAIIQPNGEL
jgi:L-iditol 2-dehydrogenase